MTLLTVPDLEAEIGMTIPPDRVAAGRSACERASALVLGHLRMAEATLVLEDAWRVDAVKGVALGIARDMFANPMDRASYQGPDGLQWAGTPRTRRTLFDSEKAALDGLWVDGFA